MAGWAIDIGWGVLSYFSFGIALKQFSDNPNVYGVGGLLFGVAVLIGCRLRRRNEGED